MATDHPVASKKQELKAFFFLTVVLAPALAVTSVIGIGFTVWIFQLLTGRLPGA